jgi:hypothetical protein
MRDHILDAGTTLVEFLEEHRGERQTHARGKVAR